MERRVSVKPKEMVAHTGLEPVISALRGQRVSRLHQCAVPFWIIGAPRWQDQVAGPSCVHP